MDWALYEDVLAGEKSSRHGVARAEGVVVGVGTVAEGITSGEVMASEAACTGCVELLMTVVMIFVPRVNADEEWGW